MTPAIKVVFTGIKRPCPSMFGHVCRCWDIVTPANTGINRSLSQCPSCFYYLRKKKEEIETDTRFHFLPFLCGGESPDLLGHWDIEDRSQCLGLQVHDQSWNRNTTGGRR